MSKIGEDLTFRYHGNYGGPNYCGGVTLNKGEPCDYDVPPVDRLDSLFRQHDRAYDMGDHGRADADFVSDWLGLWSTKRDNPLWYAGTDNLAGEDERTARKGFGGYESTDFIGNYFREFPEFIKGGIAALGFAFKSYGARAPTPEDPSGFREGIKKSTDNIMTKEAKAKRRAEKRKAKKKGTPKHVSLSRPVASAKVKSAINRVISTEKALVAKAEQTISAAPPIGRKYNDGFVRRGVRDGKVVVLASMPLGPITIKSTDKYLDIKQVVRVNPFLFSDTTVISEARIHEKYTVKHKLVYQSYCGSATGGAIAVIFDPDPHDEYGPSLNKGADLQNSWKLQINSYQPQDVATKTVVSKMLWTSNKDQGLPKTGEAIDTRLTEAGTWVIYVRAPVSGSGASDTIGEFSIISEFTFHKQANEGLADYGINFVGTTQGSTVAFPTTDVESRNVSNNNFAIGSQMDPIGQSGWGVGHVNSIPLWMTAGSGTWMVIFGCYGTSGAGANISNIYSYNCDVAQIWHWYTAGGSTPLIQVKLLIQIRNRNDKYSGFAIKFANTIATQYRYWQFVPLNNESFDVLMETATNTPVATDISGTGPVDPPQFTKSIVGKGDVTKSTPNGKSEEPELSKKDLFAQALSAMLEKE